MVGRKGGWLVGQSVGWLVDCTASSGTTGKAFPLNSEAFLEAPSLSKSRSRSRGIHYKVKSRELKFGRRDFPESSARTRMQPWTGGAFCWAAPGRQRLKESTGLDCAVKTLLNQDIVASGEKRHSSSTATTAGFSQAADGCGCNRLKLLLYRQADTSICSE